MSETFHSTETKFCAHGMDCAGCAKKIENALRRMPGVTDVNVSVAGGGSGRTRSAEYPGDEKPDLGVRYAVPGAEEVGATSVGDSQRASQRYLSVHFARALG